jgi:hypothetical protein
VPADPAAFVRKKYQKTVYDALLSRGALSLPRLCGLALFAGSVWTTAGRSLNVTRGGLHHIFCDFIVYFRHEL